MAVIDYDKLFFQADNLRNTGNSSQAITKYREIAKIAERDGQKSILGRALHQAGVAAKLAATSPSDSFYRDAKAYFEAAIQVFTEIDDQVSLGAVWRDKAVLDDYVGLYPESAANFHRSLEILTRAGSAAHLGITLVKFGHHYQLAGDLETAKKYLDQGLAKLKEDPAAGFFYASTLLSLAEFHFQQTEYAEAIEQAELSLSWFEADHDGETYSRRLAQVTRLLAGAYRKIGDEKKADLYLRRYQEQIKNFDPYALRALKLLFAKLGL